VQSRGAKHVVDFSSPVRVCPADGHEGAHLFTLQRAAGTQAHNRSDIFLLHKFARNKYKTVKTK
jgi:hypothetical protein